MARRNNRAGAAESISPDPVASSEHIYETNSASSLSLSTSPLNSDKENQDSRRGKRKSYTMAERTAVESSTSKRQRLQDRSIPQRSRAALQEELSTRVDRKYYDPDQDLEQVRVSKRKYRDLISRVNDSRAEYLQSNSKGIENALCEADHLYGNVKQTSVATIDSRLLVSVGDLANKKVNTLTLGDSTIGVDVDEFVTNCIHFMKRGDEEEDSIPEGISLTQSQRQGDRRRRRAVAEEEDMDDAEGNPMNWSYLGRNACFLYNSRPCLSGFLLGPLSVQKRARQPTQRRARQTQVDPSQAARPTELGDEDLEKQESANLTVICGEIARLLQKTITKGTTRVEKEYELMETEPSKEELQDLMARYGLTDNGCVPLFNFCVNPKSFGQTVENMFYVSFLIKEGKVGLDFDSHGLPTLGTADAKSVAERQETQRNQAVFTLDFDIWRELVHSFAIEKSIIPHREEEDWDDGTLQTP